MKRLDQLFPHHPFAAVAMLHMPPLPGSAGFCGDMAEAHEIAVTEACFLTGMDVAGLMLQNSSDMPYQKQPGPETIAALAAVGARVTAATSLPLGFNVAKNDGPGAIAAACAAGGAFIRVKVFTGAAVGAEGVLEGCAAETLAQRRRLGQGHVAVWADVADATTRPLAPIDAVDLARQALNAGADALVVTGRNADETEELLARLKEALPKADLVVGGGVTPATVPRIRKYARAAIVGAYLRLAGSNLAYSPLDAGKTEELLCLMR